MDAPVSSRLHSLLFDIAMRLRDVCKGWPDEQFENLVRSVADIAMRYDMGVDRGAAQGPIGDQIVADMSALANQNAERPTELH